MLECWQPLEKPSHTIVNTSTRPNNISKPSEEKSDSATGRRAISGDHAPSMGNSPYSQGASHQPQQPSLCVHQLQGNYQQQTQRDIFGKISIGAHLALKNAIIGCLCGDLTARELDIVELVAKGLSNREIALKLHVSRDAVKQALKRMFRKLDVSARAEMVAKVKQ